jgi:hypothetical protein
MMWLSAIHAFRRSDIWRGAAVAPQARQKCGASLVVAGDHNDSEHDHDSGNNFDDKPEATRLLAAAFTVSLQGPKLLYHRRLNCPCLDTRYSARRLGSARVSRDSRDTPRYGVETGTSVV